MADLTTDPGANANKAGLALIPSIIFPVLAFIIVAFRLVTRFAIIKNVGLEDWFITLALVSICSSTASGAGQQVC